MSRPGRPPRPLDVGDIVRRHQDGEPVTRIARSMHVHNERICAVLIAAGVEVRHGAWGKYHPRWIGGRQVMPEGYVRITLDRDDPLRSWADKNGTIFEHRLVMARALGRRLRDDETVHHIDNDGTNNALDNLQLRFGDHGRGIVLTCLDCGSHNVCPQEL